MNFWLVSAFGVNFRNLSRFNCKMSKFLVYYLHTLAPWTLILLTIERMISVWYPFRCKELCSKRRIVITWVIIAVLLFAVNVPNFRAFDLRPIILNSGDRNTSTIGYSCIPVDDYWNEWIYGRWAVIDAVLADFFPFIVILTGNIFIITRILKSHWERKSQMGAASASKLMKSATAKLIGLSAMFLTLTTPLYAAYLHYFNTDRNSLQKKEKAIYDLAYCVGILCINSNSAFEFIVYIGGGKFRKAFLETFLPCRKINNQNWQRTMERHSISAGTTSSVV